MRYLLFLFIAGVIFRLGMASFVPQPFINDQRDYEWYATKILKDPHMIASHTFRSYPMGLLTAVVYKVAGFGNHTAVIVLQAIMDSSVICMLFYAALFGLQSKRTAWIVAILYTFNPFTAGYVNVVLAEILTVWLIAAVILTGVLLMRRMTIIRGIVFGIALGLAAESRNAAFLWIVIPLGFLHFIKPVMSWKRVYGGIACGIILTMLYPLYANWRDYKTINITTVDSFYAKELYNGAIIKVLPPLAPPLPQETYKMYAEYYTEYWPERQNKAYRSTIAKEYYKKAWDVIRKDPVDYIKARVYKMWYVWQKEALYVYTEPGFESRKLFTYTLNLFVLALSVSGIFIFPVSGNRIAWWMRGMIAGSIAYGSLVFCVTHAEYRLTIPFYPLLFLSASVTISYLTNKVIELNHRKTRS